MASTSEAPRPFYLSDNFAPVEEERSAFELPVRGSVPESLRGVYLRNGPNPVAGVDPGHWFLGDGMVHGVRLEEGGAAWYRNRWVRTRPFEEPGLQFVSADGSVDRTVALANTNVVGHAGRILALVETSFPTELSGKLETIGLHSFDDKLATAMTAHPKICPTTGEMHFFGYGFSPPYLTYHCADANGVLVRSEEITVGGPTMIHDFAITSDHVVFMDLPIVLDFEGLESRGMPYAWSDDYPARFGIMPRSGGDADIRWVEIEPCYIFHPMNAFELAGKLVLDAARYPELWRNSANEFDAAYLYRFSIDLDSEKVTEEALDDRPSEFPRIDDRLCGLPNRYGYAVVSETDVGAASTSLIKYDLVAGTSEIRDFGLGSSPGEAVFVPAHPDAEEDEGYLLALVYDAAREVSDLVILDARSFDAEPLAVVSLPRRVPFGFHGNWVADPADS
ncbi:MAG: carotenoid oxygenase family protein [Myxococcales bacterium]|nr:carotenoid oxygenase family protein [Myxococcales bacterium]